MNPIPKARGNLSPSQPERLLRLTVEGLLGIAVAGLCVFGLSLHSIKWPRLIPVLVFLLLGIICILILRQLPVVSPASRPFGQTRRRLNVLGYFFGLFGIFLTAELQSLRLPIPRLTLDCLEIASFALFGFLGAQLFSRNNQNTDLGALWTGSRRIFD